MLIFTLNNCHYKVFGLVKRLGFCRWQAKLRTYLGFEVCRFWCEPFREIGYVCTRNKPFSNNSVFLDFKITIISKSLLLSVVFRNFSFGDSAILCKNQNVKIRLATNRKTGSHLLRKTKTTWKVLLMETQTHIKIKHNWEYKICFYMHVYTWF